MTCLCPICLPLKTPLFTKLDNFCFNSRLRNENGGHTFSLTSAEKEEENEVVADGLEVANIELYIPYSVLRGFPLFKGFFSL